ncbi:MAG: thermonuclease family protein [Nitrospirae bacterium]|nr:thermonuclease family protein [Nitrospirota bacterium]
MRICAWTAAVFAVAGCNSAFWDGYYRTDESAYSTPPPHTATSAEKEYRVHRVMDGATLEVWNKGRIETVRLEGVVTAPTDTTWGKSARDALRYLEGKSVTIDACPKKDREGRTVGGVFYKGENIAEKQLKKGRVGPDRSSRPCSLSNQALK